MPTFEVGKEELTIEMDSPVKKTEVKKSIKKVSNRYKKEEKAHPIKT